MIPSDVSELDMLLPVLREAKLLPLENRISFVQGYLLSVNDAVLRAKFEAAIDVFLFHGTPLPALRQLVILLHGIRTQARWQGMVRARLNGIPNIVAIPMGYGYLDAFQFWLPGKGRKKACIEITRKIRDARRQYPDHELVVIAHSFGTYITTEILDGNPDLRLHRLLLCGSIVARDFRWDKLQGDRTFEHVVNDVGSRDAWPVMAKAFSWGYGESGTFGFRDPTRVTDRFHDYGHSDFFTAEHVDRFWLPFVQNGTIVTSDLDDQIPKHPACLSVLAVLPMKWLLGLSLVGALTWAVT